MSVRTSIMCGSGSSINRGSNGSSRLDVVVVVLVVVVVHVVVVVALVVIVGVVVVVAGIVNGN